MMGFLMDLAVILSLVYLAADAAARGVLPSLLAAAAVATFLVGGVMLRALARTVRGGALRALFTIGMPLLSLLFLVGGHAAEGQRFVTATALFSLFLMLVGIYVMVFGAFSSPQGILWNLPAFLSIIVFVVGLAANGYLPPEQAALFMIVLLLLRGVGRLFGPRVAQTTGAAYAIFLPLAGMALLALLTLGWEQGLSLGLASTPIAVLAILALILYVATRAFLGR
jgi:hypothetical protein